MEKQTAIEYEGDPTNGFVYLTQGGKKIACLYGTTAQKIERAKMIVAALQSKTADVGALVEECIHAIMRKDRDNWPMCATAIKETIDHLHAKGYLNTPQWQDLEKLKHHEEIRIWRHNDVWGCKMIWKNGKYARTFHSVSSPQKAIRFALEIDTKQPEDTE